MQSIAHAHETATPRGSPSDWITIPRRVLSLDLSPTALRLYLHLIDAGALSHTLPWSNAELAKAIQRHPGTTSRATHELYVQQLVTIEGHGAHMAIRLHVPPTDPGGPKHAPEVAAH